MKVNKTIIKCTLCNREIGEYDGKPNNFIVNPMMGSYQEWPVGNGETIDVCKQCCNTLSTAKLVRIIDYDDAPLHIRAGYIWEGSYWTYKGIV